METLYRIKIISSCLLSPKSKIREIINENETWHHRCRMHLSKSK